jgi:taurine transport system permease protein
MPREKALRDAPTEPGSAAAGRDSESPRRPRPPGPRLRPPRYAWITLLTLLAVGFAWVMLTTFQVITPLFLPSPQQVWSTFLSLCTTGFLGHTLPQDLLFSLERVAVGFLTGIVFGTALGLAMGISSNVNALLSPLIQFFRPLPPLSYLVLLVAIFGIGEFPQDLLLFLSAFPVAAIAARDGVAQTPVTRIQAAQSLGAKRWNIFIHVIFPSALPEIFTGLQLAIGVVYSTLIAAEIISGSDGVGWMVYEAGNALRTDIVVVGIFVLGILGLILYMLLGLAERKIVHWAGR